jgi:hypothetical protein
MRQKTYFLRVRVHRAFLSPTWFYEQQCQAPWAWEKRTPEDILDLQAVKHPIFPFYSKPENMPRNFGKRINFNPSIDLFRKQ